MWRSTGGSAFYTLRFSRSLDRGKDVLLNGKKLWMAGTYFSKLAAIRYLNDRHPQCGRAQHVVRALGRIGRGLAPQNLVARRDAFNASLAAQVRREDGTRPLADDSDITAWSQSSLRDPRNPNAKDYDDGSRMAAQLAASTKPLLTKEIYAGVADVENRMRAGVRGFLCSTCR